jgi:hypothetical protein
MISDINMIQIIQDKPGHAKSPLLSGCPGVYKIPWHIEDFSSTHGLLALEPAPDRQPHEDRVRPASSRNHIHSHKRNPESRIRSTSVPSIDTLP